MSDIIRINISLEDLDMVYEALEAHQPKPQHLEPQSILEMGLHNKKSCSI